MGKRDRSKKSGKGKFVAVGIGIAIVIGIGAAVMQNSGTPSTASDPRTVFWRHIHGLGIDPSDSSILYIATHGDFYQSIDGGPPVKVDEQRADYMAFNGPADTGVPLYASGHPSTGGNTGLIKSTDGGRTWQVVSTVLSPPVDFHAMAVSRSDPGVIVGFDSGGRGLFKTVDAGKTWEKLGYPPNIDYVSALTVSPDDPQMVFAGTDRGIFQSMDGGASWVQLNQYKGITVLALTFGWDGTLFASTETFGLAESSDLGKTWETISSPDLVITSFAVDSQGVIYVAGYSPDGYQEVYRSSSNGQDWKLVGTNKEL